ncbi:hypothetical protein QBC38DRAFT_525855 [Podospora fimiseda]|uniref:LCCL domain-containing protein n=1 Tax=Podospora fimiseda TaxID=252190 RepID=A0AAN7BYJ1_9PEZI|nr:hypothetical protein QBC38DRAFT_525855 [Podospora fimiseda]
MSSSSSLLPGDPNSNEDTDIDTKKYGPKINTRALSQNDDEEAQLLSSSPEENESDSDSEPDHHPTPTTSKRPKRYKITSALFLSRFQEFPSTFLNRILPHTYQKSLLLFVSLGLLLLTIFLPLSKSKGGLVTDSGEEIHQLSCTSSLVPFKSCGINLEDCRPWKNHTFTFRCPSGCETVRVLNPHYVGGQEIVYRQFVIGGEEGRYRGDSFICQAGIHSGIVGRGGGCGKVRVEGGYYRFLNGGKERNGVEAVGFEGWYDLSFGVEGYEDDRGDCRGERRFGWEFWGVVIGTGIITWGSTDARVVFWVMVGVGFIWVGLIGDAPDLEVGSKGLLASLVSICVGRLLPGLFCLGVIWRFVVRRTLDKLPGEVGFEKMVLWNGGFWIGALVNETIEPMIPLARLTKHDLEQQPGAVVGLVSVVGVILGIAGVQAYCFWREGRLRRYLMFFGGMVLGLGGLAMLPGLELRIHHYILALLLLPGTSLQTRPSLLFQGLLIGIFVNGVARWGFDSLLQTADMLRGDGEFGSLLPEVKDVLVRGLGDGVPVESISFGWEALPFKWDGVGWDILQGISVMVNDVERYRGWFSEKVLEKQRFTWYRGGDMLGRGVKTDEYFRFGFTGEGGKLLDYTKAGIWYMNGTWSY